MADPKDTYDYVVIGAGSAGCVVASRLSEDQHSTVLLLEAGPSDKDFSAIPIPGQAAMLQQTEIDWSFKTVPQQHAAQGFTAKGITWPRGKVLGGSSSLNLMAYARGHSADYDSWERLGCEGWGWKDVLPYFMKSENNTCKKHTDPKHHSVGGPLTVSNNPGFRTHFSREFIKAGEELGYKEIDINCGNNIGFGDCPATISDGQRCSTAAAFLHPAMGRKNLTVITNAHVNKVVIEDRQVVGVDYLLGDQTESVHVNREVAVCGGVVNSPQPSSADGTCLTSLIRNYNLNIDSGLDIDLNWDNLPSVELGYKEIDINCGNNIGFGDCPATISDGQRCSTAAAFLHPAMGRKNLTVITNAHVNKVVIEDRQVVGVDYILGDQTESVHVNREVAVCGGVVNSPQILMLSGIGPRSHLESLGIECIADLPVGKNLQDHLFCQSKGSANPESGALSMSDLADPKHLEQYKLNQEGLLSNNGLESVAFIKTGLESDIDWPDLQIHPMSVYYAVGANEPEVLGIKSKDLYPCLGYDVNPDDVMSYKGIQITPILEHPKSVGEITLASKDPNTPPIIDPHYLEHPHDVKVLAEGIRFAKRIAETNVMRKLGVKMVIPKMPGTSGDAYSDENLEEYIRHFATTIYHPIGTCKMGSVEDSTAVVDPKLRVHGIKGLRVIDASIMPHITSGNTNAPTIMIGERGADFMKSSVIRGK